MPDFAEGDMQISVPDGSLVKEATIIKPEDLTPENIRKGVTIGGIEGEFLGDTEEIEVELDMADGDQVILPSEDGKVISKAIVAKPDALAPENIRFGVNLAGIEGKYTGAEAEEVAVDLDFSEGDMVIAPEEDKVFSTVKIPKPDTLIPENIAEGVDIAGIVGALTGGGKVAMGNFVSSTTDIVTVEHGLGVIPDVIFIYTLAVFTSVSPTYRDLKDSFTVSEAFFKKTGWKKIFSHTCEDTSDTITLRHVNSQFLDGVGQYAPINSANDKTFCVGNDLYRTSPTSAVYYWLAIGGLT